MATVFYFVINKIIFYWKTSLFLCREVFLLKKCFLNNLLIIL